MREYTEHCGCAASGLSVGDDEDALARVPMLAASDATSATIVLDADVVRAYSHATPLSKLRFAETFARPRSAKPTFAPPQRPQTAAPAGARPRNTGAAQRQRPRTAPSGDRDRGDVFTAAAVEAVVQSQREAQQRLMEQIMVHEAWVQTKREFQRGADERGGGGGHSSRGMNSSSEPGSPNRVTTSVHRQGVTQILRL